MELSAKNVEKVMMYCLNKEKPGKLVIAGIRSDFYLDESKLNDHKENIIDMLNELPEEFHQDGGGGMSFLNACNNADGEQWTGFHQTMEALFVLGMGIKRVRCLLPKEMWSICPGGMPYYMVMKKEIKDVC